MNRRDFLVRASAFGAVAAAGVAGYAVGIEPHWVEVERRDLPVAGLPRALDGARLVQISDLHVGPRVSDAYLVDCLARVAALRPDVLVVTGDLITRTAGMDAATTRASLFAQLRAVLAHLPHGRLATVAVLGNHDFGLGWRDGADAARVTAELERAGVRVLRNDAVAVRGLDLVGVDDLWSGGADARTALARRAGDAAIALCHNPDGVDLLDWGDFRGWVLAGHTHGGQVRPPFLPPPVLPVRNRRYTAGVIPLARGGALYINRGLGHLLHVRFNVRPEITAFTLRAATA